MHDFTGGFSREKGSSKTAILDYYLGVKIDHFPCNEKICMLYRRVVSRKCNSWTPTIDSKTVKIDQFKCNEKICMFLPEVFIAKMQ